MHYITFLDDRSQKISRARRKVNIKLRGYDSKTWVLPELSYLSLPAYAIAYSPCPTYRDIYLEFVQGMQRPFTWGRYKGKLIDKIYKRVHSTCEKCVSTGRLRDFDMWNQVIQMRGSIVEEAKRTHSGDLAAISPQPSTRLVSSLDEELKMLVTFEAGLTSALMNYQISKVESPNLRRIFSQYFDFNVDLSFRALHQGFRGDATPDFVYKHQVVGDIKSGKWQAFFEQTMIAYALAYEEHTRQNMDYGVIFHVGIEPRRTIPAHYRTRFEILDDPKRMRYIAVRNRKFEIIHNRIDPGLPTNSEACDPECSFFMNCRGNAHA